MKSGFYYTKTKQKKSIKPLKVLHKYISPIFGPNFGKISQWVGGMVSAAPTFWLLYFRFSSINSPPQHVRLIFTPPHPIRLILPPELIRLVLAPPQKKTLFLPSLENWNWHVVRNSLSICWDVHFIVFGESVGVKYRRNHWRVVRGSLDKTEGYRDPK